jgi:hypothetical protein
MNIILSYARRDVEQKCPREIFAMANGGVQTLMSFLLRTHIHTHIYIYIYTYICVCIYIYTHTHTHTQKIFVHEVPRLSIKNTLRITFDENAQHLLEQKTNKQTNSMV